MRNFYIIENYNEKKRLQIITFLESKVELPTQLSSIFPVCLSMMMYKVKKSDLD
jgi:hypothetical protein